MVIERKAELSFVDPRDPRAATQIVSGMYPDGWMSAQASVLLKPAPGLPLRLEFYIPPAAPARHVQMFANGRLLAEETFAGPGVYAIVAPYERALESASPSAAVSGAGITVTLTVDRTYSVPTDSRQLGVVVTGVGFR